jgi:hypothetical protein
MDERGLTAVAGFVSVVDLIEDRDDTIHDVGHLFIRGLNECTGVALERCKHSFANTEEGLGARVRHGRALGVQEKGWAG